MATLAASTPVRWHRTSLAETDASDLASAARYRGSKNIFVPPMVVTELKFRDIQRHIFGAAIGSPVFSDVMDGRSVEKTKCEPQAVIQ